MKEVKFSLNGGLQTCQADDSKVLLDFLRTDKGLTGASDR